jgi:hypothetical protein
MIMIVVIVPDRGSVNCLDPGPCYNDEGTSVCARGICPTPDLAPPLSPQGIVSRDSASTKGTCAWRTPTHLGRVPNRVWHPTE